MSIFECLRFRKGPRRAKATLLVVGREQLSSVCCLVDGLFGRQLSANRRRVMRRAVDTLPVADPGILRWSKDLHELGLSVAVEPSKVRDPLDGLLLGVHLDDGETGYQLLRLHKGAVGH